MNLNEIYINIKKIIIIFLIILLYIIHSKQNNTQIEKRIYKIINSFKINKIEELFQNNIKKKTVLLFEANNYHFECLPGYAKYFVDLGYNIDILVHKFGINSFCLFNEISRIRFFVFENLQPFWAHSKKFIAIIKNYDFVVIQTTNNKNKPLFHHLKFLNMNNTIFVFQNIYYVDENYKKFFEENRAWTLGNMSVGLQVNPHYFGNIKIKEKNKKTIFFLTSTSKRNYTSLIQSAIKLKKDNLNFEIIVIGWWKFLSSKSIPKNLINNFSFKYHISFEQFYKEVYKSDFIIIPLDPKGEIDKSYRTIRVSGSIQLSYGFLKPLIIDKKFSDFYCLNNKNSLIYENYDLYSVMKKAIELNNKEYRQLRNNLNKTASKIYNISINNIKKIIV